MGLFAGALLFGAMAYPQPASAIATETSCVGCPGIHRSLSEERSIAGPLVLEPKSFAPIEDLTARAVDSPVPVRASPNLVSIAVEMAIFLRSHPESLTVEQFFNRLAMLLCVEPWKPQLPSTRTLSFSQLGLTISPAAVGLDQPTQGQRAGPAFAALIETVQFFVVAYPEVLLDPAAAASWNWQCLDARPFSAPSLIPQLGFQPRLPGRTNLNVRADSGDYVWLEIEPNPYTARIDFKGAFSTTNSAFPAKRGRDGEIAYSFQTQTERNRFTAALKAEGIPLQPTRRVQKRYLVVCTYNAGLLRGCRVDIDYQPERDESQDSRPATGSPGDP